MSPALFSLGAQVARWPRHFGTAQSGLYSHKTGVTFDDFPSAQQTGASEAPLD